MSEVNACADLVALTKAVTNPPLDADNSAFRGAKYTKLPTLLEHVRKHLPAHNFALLQEVTSELTENGPEVAVTSVLQHASGYRFTSGPLKLRPTKADPQGVAGCVTYGRRITCAALLSISGDDDQDGNDTVQVSPEFVSREQAANIQALATEVGADISAFLKYMKASSIERIRASQYNDAVSALQRKRK